MIAYNSETRKQLEKDCCHCSWVAGGRLEDRVEASYIIMQHKTRTQAAQSTVQSKPKLERKPTWILMLRIMIGSLIQPWEYGDSSISARSPGTLVIEWWSRASRVGPMEAAIESIWSWTSFPAGHEYCNSFLSGRRAGLLRQRLTPGKTLNLGVHWRGCMVPVYRLGGSTAGVDRRWSILNR